MSADERVNLRIHAERIIAADRRARGLDTSYLNFEQQYIAAMQDMVRFMKHINRMLDVFSRN